MRPLRIHNSGRRKKLWSSVRERCRTKLGRKKSLVEKLNKKRRNRAEMCLKKGDKDEKGAVKCNN